MPAPHPEAPPAGVPGLATVRPGDTPPCRLLLTPAEAAKALAISARTLWARTKAGEIPAVRIGRSVRYDPRDLAAWVECRKAPGGAAAQHNGRPG
jgi:excisionase family DNA binding protein